MSALPPKADIAERNWDVRFVPKPEVGLRRFDEGGELPEGHSSAQYSLTVLRYQTPTPCEHRTVKFQTVEQFLMG
jgi:hypothetical protein